MKSHAAGWCLATALVAVSVVAPPASGWGLATHRAIEERAIDTLPDPLQSFFREHRREISDLSVEPDTVLRERDGRKETVRHFIDLDRYGEPPFPKLPRSYRAAVERYGEEVVSERGTVPWTILEFHQRLVGELRGHDWQNAIRTAGLAGHYVADATMPLHTTADYDGKQTGSPGIHKAIEHGLVDARLGEYLKKVQVHGSIKPASAAAYGADRIFELLIETYATIPELRAAEREARHSGAFESPAYFDALDAGAGTLLAGRLSRAINFLGAFWLSAWEEAGRPTTP